MIHSYDRIKDDCDKVWYEETIFKTDIDPNDILESLLSGALAYWRAYLPACLVCFIKWRVQCASKIQRAWRP